MFEGLKKKFSSFIDSLSKKEEEEIKEQKETPQSTEKSITIIENKTEELKNKAEETTRPENKPKEPEGREETVPKAAEVQKVSQPHKEIKKEPDAKSAQITRESKEAVQPIVKVTSPQQESMQKRETHETSMQKQPKVTTATKIKGFIFGKVRISEKDADPFIEDLKLGMLQSDVNYDVSEKIAKSIRDNLVGKEVSSKGIEVEIRNTMRNSIMGVLTKSSDIDIISMIKHKQSGGDTPFKIMFIGPNGAGKTTTMAKIASMLISNNISCVLSASDTFRAAAIEQTAFHAAKLGVNVIKGTYGADPSSVAFDAIAHAKAHGTAAVLIDSAGRQETNKSLIEELRKMVRVSKPDLKIFIGESISGNALLDQVKAINAAVGLDGIILTKLDVDAKGGNTLSILSDTTVPILFFGTGEKYTDIMKYNPQFIVDNIIPNN